MSRRKPRGLRPDEEKLWNQVRKTTTPLPKVASPDAERPSPPIIEPKPVIRPKARSDFRVGESAAPKPRGHDLVPSIQQQLSAAPLQMDQKSFARMKRGKLKPEARLDLHGMTLARAHPVLIDFILGAHSDGKRLVLVITGKGKSKPDEGPIPTRQGVLRHQVPAWLRTGILAPYVLQVAEAHKSHGGSGALYVYLRRYR